MLLAVIQNQALRAATISPPDTGPPAKSTETLDVAGWGRLEVVGVVLRKTEGLTRIDVQRAGQTGTAAQS